MHGCMFNAIPVEATTHGSEPSLTWYGAVHTTASDAGAALPKANGPTNSLDIKPRGLSQSTALSARVNTATLCRIL